MAALFHPYDLHRPKIITAAQADIWDASAASARPTGLLLTAAWKPQTFPVSADEHGFSFNQTRSTARRSSLAL